MKKHILTSKQRYKSICENIQFKEHSQSKMAPIDFKNFADNFYKFTKEIFDGSDEESNYNWLKVCKKNNEST